MNFFPACPPAELMASAWVPITALIPGDPMPGLVVPVYPPGVCPEISRIRIGDYVAAYAGSSYVTPDLLEPGLLHGALCAPRERDRGFVTRWGCLRPSSPPSPWPSFQGRVLPATS